MRIDALSSASAMAVPVGVIISPITRFAQVAPLEPSPRPLARPPISFGSLAHTAVYDNTCRRAASV